MINFEAFFKVTYGLYIVSSGSREKGNGFISNTVFQITSEPAWFAASCNKNNYTCELIQSHGAFSVSILNIDASSDLIGRFGYKSGRDIEKMDGVNVLYGVTGVPVVVNDCIAYLEFKVVQTIDAGTHLIFIGELVQADLVDGSKEPMTYAYYRQTRKGVAPKNAPTYIDYSKLNSQSTGAGTRRFKCPLCGYVYDERKEEVAFSDLPADWTCPACGCEKTDFIEIN
jgi:flavin reductase (DIM6/NTAB) family NADH-FMN oxidoreductase RutF/rubredoxin